MQHSILVVDDERDIVDSIERHFRKSYKVFKATNGADALRILGEEKIHLILSDQRMPEMTGVQLFEKAQALQPEAIRILLTGYTDVESVIAAINTGHVYRYITKPWDPNDLEINIRQALETYELRADLKEKNARLEAAVEELKSLDQAKSHFMILIGHELKTPLTTVSSFLELLKEEKLPGEAAKYLARVGQGTDRLKEIVFDVLDLLSAETGQMKLQKTSQTLEAPVSTVLAELGVSIHKKSLAVDMPEFTKKAFYDVSLVTKVLRKILSNAVRFSDEKTDITISCDENNDGSLTLMITNDGPEIPKARIDQILKPFTLDEDIMHHSQGMGLGLSVSQSLLKHHGSQLLVNSKNKKTSVGFTISKK